VAQWVTVWRAAQLVGVPRGVLQQRVRSGEIELNDGLVSTETLLSLYPQAELEQSGMLERVARIREDAFGRRVRERILPSQEVLAQRLFRQSQELADVQRHLQRYHALVIELRDRLGGLLAQTGGDDPQLLAMQRQLNDGLARALATESVDVLDVMDDMLKVMSAQVTLRPSGHQFVVEGRDTLLQAGLRAGMKLNYGCGNGTCGMCKVRVISGEVAKAMPFDYPLSEAEKQQGYTLMCAHTPASSEITLETLEAQGPEDIAPQQIVTSIRALRELAPDTRLLHLQTPRSHRLRFLAGQSVTLGRAGSADTAGDDVRATYPIASCPCDDRNLHFFIAREPGNALARQVFDGTLKVGDPVNLWGPTGQFVLADSAHPLVFAACDTGFAPIKSLIEHALSLDAAPSLSLFWLATRSDGHFQANQCRAWSEALDPFEYTLFTDDDPAAGARQMAAAMRADLFDIDCDFYLAGPQAFVAALSAALLEAGVPAAQVVAEAM
jgi:CDP-4-dehydro-6-deoxyglucose reductase, E3